MIVLTEIRDEFKYEVRIPISRLIGNRYISLNTEIYSWVVQTFGLPGNRYMYHPALDMVFRFRDEQDAIWFKLRWV